MSYFDSKTQAILEAIAIELNHNNNLKEIELKKKYKDIEIPLKKHIQTDSYGKLKIYERKFFEY